MKTAWFQTLILMLVVSGCGEQTGLSNPTNTTNVDKTEQMEPAVNLHPDFPIIEGHYQMTEQWSVELPGQFNRRFEDGSLVIWKPGFTMWISVWGNDNNQAPKDQLESIKTDVSSAAFGLMTEEANGILRHAYQLNEESEDDRQPAFYGFAVGSHGYVQVALYYDSPNDLEHAVTIWRSISSL